MSDYELAKDIHDRTPLHPEVAALRGDRMYQFLAADALPPSPIPLFHQFMVANGALILWKYNGIPPAFTTPWDRVRLRVVTVALNVLRLLLRLPVLSANKVLAIGHLADLDRCLRAMRLAACCGDGA